MRFCASLVAVLLGAWGCGNPEPGAGSSQLASAAAACKVALAEPDSIFFKSDLSHQISYLKEVDRLRDGRFVVASLNQPLLVFDADGRFLNSIGSSGAGPAEYSTNYQFATGPDDEVYVVDAMQMRLVRFDSNREYRDTRVLDKSAIRSFDVDAGGRVYILNEDAFGDETAAVLVYDTTLTVVDRWGVLPPQALLQSHFEGGGFEIDAAGRRVVYGYMTDPAVTVVTLPEGRVQTLDSPPDYFIEPSLQEVDRLRGTAPSERAREISRYSRTVSWVRSLHLTPGGYLFQQVLERLPAGDNPPGDNPPGDNPPGLYLEVWDTTTGTKIATRVPSANDLLYADDQSLYFLRDVSDGSEYYGLTVVDYTIECQG